MGSFGGHSDGQGEGPEQASRWEWTVEVVSSWADFLHDDHFFFVGTDGAFRKVVAGVEAGETFKEWWEAAVAVIAAEVGTTERVVLANLRQTVSWGATDVSRVNFTEKRALNVQIIPLAQFYTESQEASASQKGNFAIVTARMEPVGDRLAEVVDREASNKKGPEYRAPTVEQVRDEALGVEDGDGDIGMDEYTDDSLTEDEDQREEDGLADGEDEEDRGGRKKDQKLIVAMPEDFVTGVVRIGEAVKAVHDFYEDLKEEKIDGFFHLSNKANRRVMKALRSLADAAAVVWNLGVVARKEGESDLARHLVNDESRVFRKLEEIDGMVTELHAKAGLAPTRAKKRMEREVEERRKKEREVALKKQAKTWAQKVAKQPPPALSIQDEDEEQEKGVFSVENPPKGPKGRATPLVLCIIRVAPSINSSEFAKRKDEAIKWFEKEIRRCYGGREIRVVDIKQERDGERKIKLELPEGLSRTQAKDEIPGVIRRILRDIKEVFWDIPVWKLVVHGVPFEERETQAALRAKLEEENGSMSLSKRSIQRLVNKRLKQKITPVVLEFEDREEAIKAAQKGIIMDGVAKIAVPYKPLGGQTPGTSSGASRSAGQQLGARKCFNCGKPGHVSRNCKNKRVEIRACFKCGVQGHLSADCSKAASKKCFGCGAEGHIRAQCGGLRGAPRANGHCNRGTASKNNQEGIRGEWDSAGPSNGGTGTGSWGARFRGGNRDWHVDDADTPNRW